MLPPGHKKLALFIAQEFSLPLDCKKALIKGCLDPDREFFNSHHLGRENEIVKWIYRARRHFLKGERVESCYWMGWALHFIADAPIYSPSMYRRYRSGRGAGLKTWHAKRRAQKLHRLFEAELMKVEFQRNHPFFILHTPLDIPSTIENFLYKDSYFSPQETLNRIYYSSFALCEITWRDPKNLTDKEREILLKIPHQKKIVLEIIGTVLFLSIFLPPLFFVTLLGIFFYFLNFLHPWRLEGWYRKKISLFGLSEI